MKSNFYLALLIIGLLTACTNNEPQNISKQQMSSGIHLSDNISYLDWLTGENKTIFHYSFLDGSSMENHVTGTTERILGDNTFMFTDDLGIRIHDSYTIENDGKNTIFHVIRDANILNNENQPQTNKVRAQDDHPYSVTLESITFDIQLQTATPIYLIRPKNRCTSIPLCYFSDMEIEWNPDYANNTGVVIVTEWNGLTMNGVLTNNTIVHSLQVEDNGIHVLPASMFEGMPDEALVNLWLIRANIEVLSANTPCSIDDLIEVANRDRNSAVEFMQDHAEDIMMVENLALASGAITVQPIFLIRSLE